MNIKRYNGRYEKFGIDPRTLGWDTLQNQVKRFNVATSNVDFKDKKVLDIGCGFGDFYKYTLQKFDGILMSEYKGIDINQFLINKCKELYERHPITDFEVRNILLENYNEQADIVTMFGLLNLKIDNNLEYTKQFINEAWKVTRKMLIVDFLSSHLDSSYPKEDFVYYHDPKVVLDMVFELTNNVKLIHDYAPIPQKEFMVVMTK